MIKNWVRVSNISTVIRWVLNKHVSGDWQLERWCEETICKVDWEWREMWNFSGCNW